MSVSASELENAVMAAIKKQAEAVIGSDDFSGFRKTTVDTRHIEDCENRIKLLSEQRQDCYERFLRGDIDRNTFLTMKSGYTEQIGEISSHAALLRQMERDKEAKKGVIAYTKEIMSEETTPKDIITALVDKVLVFPNKRLEIRWKFADFTENTE